MIVAIDGPAGAGKSTVAQEVAARLGFRYLDTGAMYRAVTREALRRGIDPSDATELAAMVRSLALELVDGKVLVDGHDVSSELRSEEVTNNVSEVSAHPAVRAALVELQQDVASDGDTIVEGRDIGSAVFPDADVKVFLTATANERALRRARQLDLPTERPAIERVARDIERRDRADSSRAASPLVRPQDAHVLDTTELAFEEVVSEIVDLIRRMR